MKNKLYLIVGILFLMLPLVYAEEEITKVDISFKILTHEYPDALVVGDSFYYEIILTNKMSQEIKDIFTIGVYNPKGELISPPRVEEKILVPNEPIEILAEGGLESEKAAFPFDIAGDYKIIINSTQHINFYRWLPAGNYLRNQQKFTYYFDAMPKWQYDLWKQKQDVNIKTLEVNEKMLNHTIKLDAATRDIRFATWVMVVVALVTLWVAKRNKR